MLDQNGIAMVYPSEKGNDLSNQKHIQKIYNENDPNIIEFYENNNKQLIVHNTIDQTGWKIASIYALVV